MAQLPEEGRSPDSEPVSANQERLERRRAYRGPLFLREGFRPLFLAAGLWAAIAVPLWIGIWSGAVAYRGVFDPLTWHIHEMTFGFAAAAIGGFLLTAVPNWTGRLPVRGLPLAALAGLWLSGRVAVWFSADIGASAAFAVDLSYLVVLGGCIGNEIVAGRNWRNLPVLGAVLLLIAANVLFHLPGLSGAGTAEIAVRLSVSVIVLLIALIGGRVVPSFTRNWFAKRGGPEIAAPMGRFDLATLAVTGLAAVLWTGLGDGIPAAVSLAAAGALNLLRLARWHGWGTAAEPLVAVLHVGYFWLGAGLLLLGASMTGGAVTATAALHVLTVGAMGTMILAVMTRAILGHTGRSLHAGPGTVAVYALATAAVLGRVLFEAMPGAALLWATAIVWSAAFALFVALYGPLVVRPARA